MLTLHTITLTTDNANPERLAESIQKRFADVVLAYETNGPFKIHDLKDTSARPDACSPGRSDLDDDRANEHLMIISKQIAEILELKRVIKDLRKESVALRSTLEKMDEIGKQIL